MPPYNCDEETIWSPYNSGLANVRVDMLNIRNNDNYVLASTHGRGQFYGQFEISNNYMLGDINLDNTLDVLDIVLLINIILDEEEFVEIADLNEDLMLNILDIVILVNIILEG